MANVNASRKGCVDVFNASLLSNANYVGYLEFPIIRTQSNEIPKKLIKFSKIFKTDDFDQFVHFYEDDVNFERIWRTPHKYLERLKKFKGVISPDFSVYRDMPLVMQLWNIFRSRAIANWLIENGVYVIPNIRFGDSRTTEIACDGIDTNSIIAIGSHGCIKSSLDRNLFVEGLDTVIKKLSPKVIVLYGSKPDYIFDKYEGTIEIVQFKDDFYSKRDV